MTCWTLLGVGFGITFVSFVGGYLPSFHLKRLIVKHSDKVDCFCAGVFLATLFMHLFPELTASFNELQDTYFAGKPTIPFIFYFVPVGYLSTQLLELIVHKLMSRGHNHSVEGNNIVEVVNDLPSASPEENGMSEASVKDLQVMEEGLDDSGVDSAAGTSQMVSDEDKIIPDIEAVNSTPSFEDSPDIEAANSTPSVEDGASATQSSEDVVSLKAASPTSLIRVVTLLVAIGVHSLLEGFTLGIQETDNAVWTLGIALMLHKGPEAFTYASQTSPAISSRTANGINLIVYSFMTPIGMFLGYVLRNFPIDGYGKDLSILLLESVGSGTFVFILLELKKDHMTFTDFLVMVIGFAIAGAFPFYEALHAYFSSFGFVGSYSI